MSKFDEIDEFLDIEAVDDSKNNKIEEVNKKDDPLLLIMNTQEVTYIL